MYIAHDKNAINSECPFFVIYRIHVNAMYIAFRLWGVVDMSETTAEFDVCTICRVTENPGLSADPFDFPVSLSAEKRSAGRFPPYHPLRRIRQCKLNRGAP